MHATNRIREQASNPFAQGLPPWKAQQTGDKTRGKPASGFVFPACMTSRRKVNTIGRLSAQPPDTVQQADAE